MKKHRLFAFYCTLLVPVGGVAGLSIGEIVGSSTVPVIIGAVLGLASSYLLLRRTAPGETP
jgi:hypothetical protein